MHPNNQLPPMRIELMTFGLQDQRSATELWRLLIVDPLMQQVDIILVLENKNI